MNAGRPQKEEFENSNSIFNSFSLGVPGLSCVQTFLLMVIHSMHSYTLHSVDLNMGTHSDSQKLVIVLWEHCVTKRGWFKVFWSAWRALSGKDLFGPCYLPPLSRRPNLGVTAAQPPETKHGNYTRNLARNLHSGWMQCIGFAMVRNLLDLWLVLKTRFFWALVAYSSYTGRCSNNLKHIQIMSFESVGSWPAGAIKNWYFWLWCLGLIH